MRSTVSNANSTLSITVINFSLENGAGKDIGAYIVQLNLKLVSIKKKKRERGETVKTQKKEQ